MNREHKDLSEAMARIREEFEIVSRMQGVACINSAMLNVQPLADEIIELRQHRAELLAALKSVVVDGMYQDQAAAEYSDLVFNIEAEIESENDG